MSIDPTQQPEPFRHLEENVLSTIDESYPQPAPGTSTGRGPVSSVSVTRM